jgi:hypothetical protein
MSRSSAATPEAYIAEQQPARAAELVEVRKAINAALPAGYVETIAWGMISWEVPLEVSGPTYNGQPLAYAALAAQKNHNALYLNCASASEERIDRLRRAATLAGKKLDMGKSCIRFQRADQLPLDAIAEEIRSTSPAEFVAMSKAARAR